VASGKVISTAIFQGPHRDGTPGKISNYVAVEWDRAVDDSELLPITALEMEIPGVKWHPQGGGVLLAPTEAEKLEALLGRRSEDARPLRSNRPASGPRSRIPRRLNGRTAIEKHGEAIAADFYNNLDYDVKFVGAFLSYHLRLVHRRTGEERHVEVKDSSGAAQAVELAAGEVEHAESFQPVDLFVVSMISWQKDGETLKTSGGLSFRRSDWSPSPDALIPVRYRYQVPKPATSMPSVDDA
jgi:hypothetical protein